jgi:alkylation response protein AidB-like acyl-CoA dehydrogenase
MRSRPSTPTSLPFAVHPRYRPRVTSALERARDLADELLFPTALTTDAADLVPVTNLDALAEAGLYGIVAPPEVGGLDLDRAAANELIEVLASGCLTTTFVWIQHHNPVRAVAKSTTPGIRDAWLEPLTRGSKRAGIARAGERPGPPVLTADRTGEGLVLNGEAPWVTGWGLIDVVLVAAREGDTVVRVLMDAAPAATLVAERLSIVAADASGTVTLRFRDHAVPEDRIVETEPLDAVLARDPEGLRTNGSLALGVISRCCTLLGPSALDEAFAAARDALDAGTPDTLPAARALVAELALRAAGALTVADGGRGILLDHHAQRLAREALFLLVFGTRASIRDDLLRRLTRP